MKYISCNLNLFTQNHSVYLHDDENIKMIAVSDTEHLPQVIAAACNQEGIENVHLFGVKSFLEPLAEDICTVNEMNYSNLNIIVEVN